MATAKPTATASSPLVPESTGTEAPGRRTTRGLPTDIQALAKVDRLLAEMADAERDRTIQWIVDKYAADDVEPARYTVPPLEHVI